MPITYYNIKEEVKKAINHFLKQKCLNIRAAARKSSVLKSRL
jgi:hypothetical protein